MCGKGAGRYKPGAQITHLCIRQTLDPVYPSGGYLIVTGKKGGIKKNDVVGGVTEQSV